MTGLDELAGVRGPGTDVSLARVVEAGAFEGRGDGGEEAEGEGEEESVHGCAVCRLMDAKQATL